jgi:hypothetical protein
MIDVFYPRGYPQAKKVIMHLTMIQLEAEYLGLDGIKNWRERIALTKTSGGMKELSCMTIHKRGYPRGTNARFYTVYKGLGETKIFHDLEQKVMPNSIKSIGKIKLNYHTFVFSSNA